MRYGAILLLLLAACASNGDDPNAPNVTLHLVPLESAPGALLYGGAVNLQYALSVTNTTNQPVTVERIEIQTIGSGAYNIRPTSTRVNMKLGPGESKVAQFSLWGNSRGGQLASQEPVTVRAAAYMSSPSGPFVRLFTEYFTQQ